MATAELKSSQSELFMNIRNKIQAQMKKEQVSYQDILDSLKKQNDAR